MFPSLYLLAKNGILPHLKHGLLVKILLIIFPKQKLVLEICIIGVPNSVDF